MSDYDSRNEFDERPVPLPPERLSRRTLVILTVMITVTVFTVATLTCCGGGMYWGQQYLAALMEKQLREIPAVQEHLGPLGDVQYDAPATAANGSGGYQVLRLQGKKGKARAEVKFDNVDGGLKITEGFLRMENGDIFPLFESDPPTKSDPADPASAKQPAAEREPTAGTGTFPADATA